MKNKNLKLAIFGFGGHSKVAYDLSILSGWKEIDFFDDNLNKSEKIVGNFKSLCEDIDLYDGIFVAVGDNNIRLKKIEKLESLTNKLITLIHPNSSISSSSKIGQGSFVGAKAVLNPLSSIGKGVIINSSSVVEHDCHVEDGAHIAPGGVLCGSVKFGKRSWLGAGSVVIENLSIGSNVIIGAGASVINDIEDNKVVVGVPAKEI